MDDFLYKLIEWLEGEKYTCVDENSQTMTEQEEIKYKYELATNIIINKTIKQIHSLLNNNTPVLISITHFKEMEKDRDRFYNMYHKLSKEYRDYTLDANKRVNRLLEEHEFLMTLCLRYEKENEELKKKIDCMQ